MKTTRRLLCALLALTLVLALAGTAFAAGGNSSALLALTLVLALAGTAFAAGGNSITVKNAKAGETYKIYKMLDLTVDATQEYFSYTLNTDWQDFFTNGGPGADYVDVSSNVVTWNGNKTDAASMEAFGKAAAAWAVKNNKNTAADDITPKTDGDITFNSLDNGNKTDAASMEAFGKAAAAWAVKNNKNTAADDITPKTDGDITFNSLDNGYYLITSTNGTLAIVDTTPTNPAPEITEKLLPDYLHQWYAGNRGYHPDEPRS